MSGRRSAEPEEATTAGAGAAPGPRGIALREASGAPVLTFVTGSDDKFQNMQDSLAPLISSGRLELVQVKDVDLPVVQAASVERVAFAQAKAAREALGRRAIVVQDSGLVIESLRDFPGPYTAYTLSTIGVSGLLNLLEGKHGEDRRCGFDNLICFCSSLRSPPDPVPVWCFREPDRYWGVIAEAPAVPKLDEQGVSAAQQLHSVFVPCDDAAPRQVPLSEFTKEELQEYRSTRTSAFKLFKNWLEVRLDTIGDL